MKMYVIFRSLLDDEEPLQRGVLNNETGFVDCLCGCNGCFEPDDCEIIRKQFVLSILSEFIAVIGTMFKKLRRFFFVAFAEVSDEH